ncbi:thioredoxin family protein [Anaplasmataceae bacterium AB001_6]|nr:thioredoxin family protein [Anaplasmataceae bacterium AB001_6]
MVLLSSNKVDFSFKAVDFFMISATDDKKYSFNDIRGNKATLVMFICNHCPYVKNSIDSVIESLHKFSRDELGIAAVMSNDTKKYPDDSFDNMKKFAAERGFFFPYLFDSSQDVAKSYGAICTPDFFVFNQDNFLRYRGRSDNKELEKAIEDVILSKKISQEQKSSSGCSIKWSDHGN